MAIEKLNADMLLKNNVLISTRLQKTYTILGRSLYKYESANTSKSTVKPARIDEAVSNICPLSKVSLSKVKVDSSQLSVTVCTEVSGISVLLAVNLKVAEVIGAVPIPDTSNFKYAKYPEP